MGVNQGSSSITAIKEAQIYGVIKTRLVQRKFAGIWIGRVHVYDIFSGDGVNQVDGHAVWGSPIETINAIVDSGLNCSKTVLFTASDKRKDSIERLQVMIGEFNDFPVRCQTIEAADQISEIGKMLEANPKDHAIIIVDPNGPGVMPFNEIRELSKRYGKRVDILLNISETAMNRILGCKITRDKNWWACFDDFSSIVCDIFENYKQAWVREVIKGDRQKWRFLCFWTYAPPKRDWSKQGIRSVSSKQQMCAILKKGVDDND